MPSYRVELRRSAHKELEALPDGFLVRVWSRIESLAAMPRPSGCKKLRGAADLWRVRVGAYRIVYRIDDAATSVIVEAIGDRKDVYG